MALQLYNTLTNQKELFEPVELGKVGVYVCGPTVYKDSHIGHAVGPVIFDAFKKYLTYKGYKVTFVVNITDVDDKIMSESQKLGVPMRDLAEKVTANYLDCLDALGVDSIDHLPRATEHIDQIIELIGKLAESDAAYAVEGDVYFDITKDDDYGKLSNRKTADQAEGTRDLAGKTKRNPGDFAMWKAAADDEVGWDSPWGRGRPGWHIECSAMSMQYLGETFDIHGGGIDLVFPHHENEIAQSETATGKPFARYWLHNGLTRMRTKAASGEWKDEKMSKSLGNIRTIKELLQTWPGPVLRFFLLSTQYRSPIDFSDEAIAATQKGMNSIYRVLERVGRLSQEDLYNTPCGITRMEDPGSETQKALKETIVKSQLHFLEALDDDFNTAGAIAGLFDLCNSLNRFIESEQLETHSTDTSLSLIVEGSHMLTTLGQILGLFNSPLQATAPTDGLTDDLMQILIDLRAQARQDKNFALSDAIRDRLSELKITLEDHADGTLWTRS